MLNPQNSSLPNYYVCCICKVDRHRDVQRHEATQPRPHLIPSEAVVLVARSQPWWEHSQRGDEQMLHIGAWFRVLQVVCVGSQET